MTVKIPRTRNFLQKLLVIACTNFGKIGIKESTFLHYKNSVKITKFNIF